MSLRALDQDAQLNAVSFHARFDGFEKTAETGDQIRRRGTLGVITQAECDLVNARFLFLTQDFRNRKLRFVAEDRDHIKQIHFSGAAHSGPLVFIAYFFGMVNV